jgi:hypothetical protein
MPPLVYPLKMRLPRPVTHGLLVLSCQQVEELQGLFWMSGVTAAGGGKVLIACPAHQPNGNVAKRSHDLWCAAGANSGKVLSIGNIAHPVKSLDLPVSLPGTE